MKTKRVLKFYFNADKVMGRIDRLICKKAFAYDWLKSASESAEEVAELIFKKKRLCEFTRFLHSAMHRFQPEELAVLKKYALSRGVRNLAEAERKETHRLVVAFTRRISGCAKQYDGGIEVMNEFCFFD